MKANKLKAEFANNIKRHYNYVRIIGEPEAVYGFVKNNIDKDAAYISADHDKCFYSFDFVESFSNGGVLVFETATKLIANMLLSIVQDGKLNLGGCDITMSNKFFVALIFTGKDDYFLNGRLYQI